MAIRIPLVELPVADLNSIKEFSDFEWNKGAMMLVDKPKGFTSFGIVKKVRYFVKAKKVGHAGTLDPMATGLLLICIGKATKSIMEVQELTKTYRATITFGGSTPSYDAETEVDVEAPYEHIKQTKIAEALEKEFAGEIMQKAPKYSALKIDGKRAYKLAHQGRADEIPDRIRPVTIYSTEIHDFNPPHLDITIHCSKGTYIRSIAYDLGMSLDSRAHLTALRRTHIGDYSVGNALTPEDIEQL